MKKWTAISVLLLLAVGGILYLRAPHLFERAKRSEDPLKFLQDLPEVGKPEYQAPARSRRKPARHPNEFAPPDPDKEPKSQASESPPPQVDNAEVQRVLLQIMAAQGLAKGISLSVTDTQIVVAGTVESESRRERILELLDKGRERRRISAEDLIVAP